MTDNRLDVHSLPLHPQVRCLLLHCLLATAGAARAAAERPRGECHFYMLT